ncbi:MAG: T9SS type A sorting domain-containing protein, partial [Saprospiraceae bacterium]|nr:T9SS type A sorting domain-containing protein [Saprospiraceae bacterium]
TTTAVDQFSNFKIYQFKPYPNPFFERINASFSSPGKHIRLSLINATGQEVFLLENRYFPEGDYQLSHDIPELIPGQYFCQFKSTDFHQSIPLIHF